MCETCNYETYQRKVDRMLRGHKFGFAREFLSSVSVYMNQHEHITEKQKKAVENIAHAQKEYENNRPDGRDGSYGREWT